MSKKKKVILIVVGIVAIAVILTIIIAITQKRKTSATQETEISFQTTPLTKRDLTSSISVTGTLASAETYTVTSGLADVEILEVNVSVGDYVNAGDVLCTFKSDTVEDALEEAQSNYSLESQKGAKNIKDAKDSITQAEEKYTDGINENNSLIAEAKESYDLAVSKESEAKQAYEDADDAVAKAKEAYEKAKEDKSSKKKAMEKAQKAFKEAEAAYEKASVATDVELTSEVYDTYQAAKAEYERAKAEYDQIEQEQKALDEAKSARTAAKEAYEAASSAVSPAYSAYETAQANASDQNADNAKEIETKKEEYDITSAEISNNLETQKNQVDQAEEKLDDCVVTAPISGVITSVPVQVGDTYKGEDIAVIQDMEHFVVDATVDEYDISDIAVGMKAVIKTDATDDEELAGEVTFVAPTPNSTQGNIGNTGNETASYSIQITLTDINERLRIGMTAKTSILLDAREDVFAVAYDCIQTDPQGNSYIMVLNNSTTSNSSQGMNRPQGSGTISGNAPDAANRPNASGDADSSNNETGNFNPQTADAQGNRPSKDGQTTSASQSGNNVRRIQVTTGMESDYYVEIISDELTENMQVVTTFSQSDNASSSNEENRNMMFGMPGGGGNMGGGGNYGGGGRPSGAPGGF